MSFLTVWFSSAATTPSSSTPATPAAELSSPPLSPSRHHRHQKSPSCGVSIPLQRTLSNRSVFAHELPQATITAAALEFIPLLRSKSSDSTLSSSSTLPASPPLASPSNASHSYVIVRGSEYYKRMRMLRELGIEPDTPMDVEEREGLAQQRRQQRLSFDDDDDVHGATAAFGSITLSVGASGSVRR